MLDFLEYVNQLPSARILCIGDLMLDRYVYGQVNRISPEAPVPVLHLAREEMVLGGVGNVLRNIHAAKASCGMIAVCGADWYQPIIEQKCQAMEGVKIKLIVDPLRPTTIKTRYVSGNSQLLRVDHEMAHLLKDELEDQVIEAYRSMLPDYDLVICSDYKKGLLTSRVLQAIFQFAQESGKLVIIDPKGHSYEAYKGASIMTPNLKELNQALKADYHELEDIIKGGHQLKTNLNLTGLVITCGKEGVVIIDEENQATHIPTFAREVYDVSGAGDTVIAYIGMMLALGATLSESARLANVAAGVVVSKMGTATVHNTELIQALEQQHLTDNRHKIMGLAQAKDLGQRWQHQGYKVGFTNGCFDLLHAGHLAVIQQTRRACDRLIIGMNSDTSVKKLKGDARPIQDQHTRALVLAALSDVDVVIIFDEETPHDLILGLSPQVLAKGGDYQPDTIVGAEHVQSYGGEILIISLVEGMSTTNTIARINT